MDHFINPMFLGVVATTMLAIEFLKKKFEWFVGKEAWMSFLLPALLSVAAKFGGCTEQFAQLSWGNLVFWSLLTGVFAQISHDKVYNPFVRPTLSKMSAFLGGLTGR